MSPSDNFLAPARRADGSLKDASEMEWSYDKDETLPFPAPESTVDEQVVAPTVHPFFTGAAAPAQIVGGARRSVRTHRPSRRVLEAMPNSEDQAGPSSGNARGKRKAAVAPSGRRISRKVVTDTDDEVSNGEASDGEASDCTASDSDASITTEDINVDNAGVDSATYQHLQEMADADHKVRLLTTASMGLIHK